MRNTLEAEQVDWLIKELLQTKPGEMMAFLSCTTTDLLQHYWTVARNYQRLNDKQDVEVPAKAIEAVEDLNWCLMQMFLEAGRLRDDLKTQNLHVAARKLQQEAAAEA